MRGPIAIRRVLAWLTRPRQIRLRPVRLDAINIATRREWDRPLPEYTRWDETKLEVNRG